MHDFLGLFDDREKALFIWLAIMLAVTLCIRDVRGDVAQIARTLVSPPLSIALLLTGLYVAGVVGLLAWVGAWNLAVLDVTLFWFFGTALGFFGSAVDAAKDPEFVRKLLRRSFASLLGVEFVVNLYVFPLSVELVLVPTVAVVVVMAALAATKKEFVPVRTLSERVMLIFGLFLLVRAVAILVSDIDGFATSENLMGFALPVVLSLALLPFIYVLAIYAIYEVTFVRLNFLLQDRKLAWFAKRAMLRAFHLKFGPLRRFAREGPSKLAGVQDERDVLAVIRRFGTDGARIGP